MLVITDVLIIQNYKPVTVAFKAPENLEEIVREEEKQIA